jgi:hypothetical protein
MQCPCCQHESTLQKQFCEECAATLARRLLGRHSRVDPARIAIMGFSKDRFTASLATYVTSHQRHLWETAAGFGSWETPVGNTRTAHATGSLGRE